MNRPSLEGANCADLSPDATERYFQADSRSFEGKIGRAICSNCVAIADCWVEALAEPPRSGIQAGHTAWEIRHIRKRMKGEHGHVSVEYLTPEERYPVVEPLRAMNKLSPIVPGKRYMKTVERRAAS